MAFRRCPGERDWNRQMEGSCRCIDRVPSSGPMLDSGVLMKVRNSDELVVAKFK